MIIAIASGKGGTGKSTVAVNLSLSLENVQLIDCDVEEPNSNLFLNLDLEKDEEVYLKIPKIDEENCTHCKRCAEFCEYNALAVLEDKVMVFEQLCHGCGLCSMVCPTNAITEKNRSIGVIEKSRDGIDFIRGVLNIGEAMSTPIIRRLKEKTDKKKTVILDVPPGTACPVIEAITGCDYCMLVTEPTPFGLYDLKIAVELCKKLKVRFGVIINRDGIGDEKTEEFCKKEDIDIILRIPYNRRIAELYSEGKPFIDEMPEWKTKLREVYRRIHEDIRK